MRVLVLSIAAILAASSAASAEDVLFNGTVISSCSILGHTDGTLAVDMTSDGKILTSELPYGLPATLTMLSVGSNFINVAAPTRTAEPVAYVATGESIEVAYQGVGLLSSVTQAFTASGTSQAATALLATVVTIDNRITNTANGFPAGTYQTKTVVTCTPTAQF
jgi:hypothetical protein